MPLFAYAICILEGLKQYPPPTRFNKCDLLALTDSRMSLFFAGPLEIIFEDLGTFSLK